jgi:hypothetical protein
VSDWSEEMTVKDIADAIVIGAASKCMITPIVAIFGGGLWGPGAFLGGAIVVATVLFGEFYFQGTSGEV